MIGGAAARSKILHLFLSDDRKIPTCHQHATGDLPSCLHNGLAFLLGISKL